MAKLPLSFDASQFPQEDPIAHTPEADANPFAGLFQQPETATDDPWNAPAPQSAPTRSRHVTCHLDTEGKLVIDDIPDGYTDEEREILAHWYPELYGKPSEHALNSHKVVLTGEDVLAHARIMFKEMEKAEATKRKARKDEDDEHQAEFASAHMSWIAECGQRKTAIVEAKKELRSRTAARKLALAQFNAQWEEYIANARNMVQAAEDVPVPQRPEKAR